MTFTKISCNTMHGLFYDCSLWNYIHKLWYINSFLAFITTSTTAIFTVQFKLDYCNSLYYNPSNSATNTKFTHSYCCRVLAHIPAFSNHYTGWKLKDRTQYKHLHHTYEDLTTSQPISITWCLLSLITVHNLWQLLPSFLTKGQQKFIFIPL